ncbi:Apurinic endonuclease-like protein [Venustampulla echinocandica]|uniref:Apurinic-apyrimidinic endonuclease 1 n=1 Tax=Venustampulla echinocandica TaxID=2656787 RepID=A0A370THY4_9HELO|nr:Apurinic endonuclease-like protein [Venustampulla echinocandica]RDL34807.1 Apurinic endonuclease-like protein [Venustampulla echinocandica]
MPRRSNRGSEKQARIAKSDTIRSVPTIAVTPTVKVETREPVAEGDTSMPKSRSIRKKKIKTESDLEKQTIKTPLTSPEEIKTNRVKAEAILGEQQATLLKGASKKRKATTKGESGEEAPDDIVPKKKRNNRKKKEEEVVMPLAERSVVGILKKSMYIGSHTSAAKGVHNSIDNALHVGANSFALFLQSQRKWVNPPLAPEARDQFRAFCLEHKYDAAKHILPHGSYLVNLAELDAVKAERSYTAFLNDLQRCEDLGIKLYNFHPGNTGKRPRPEAIARLAAQLNKAHKATSTVITVLESMAGGGNVIGSTWEDLRDIIALVDDKSRVGICIDTCHSFAHGYDLRSPEAFRKTMDGFASTVGMQYLKALHLNDSKAPFLSKRDAHANIGTGFLGLRAFHNVVNFDAFQHLPMVLETPVGESPDGKVKDWGTRAKEIKLLEGLIGLDPETDEFIKEEQRLQDIGAADRKKFQEVWDRNQQKASKKKKIQVEDSDGDDSDASCKSCDH